MAYTKLHHKLLRSSVWVGQPLHIRTVWIALLCLRDDLGEILDVSIPGIAEAAGVTVEQALDAIGLFTSPDPYSQNPAEDGRRLTPIAGGWRLVTHDDHLKLGSTEDEREQARKRKRKERAQKRAGTK